MARAHARRDGRMPTACPRRRSSREDRFWVSAATVEPLERRRSATCSRSTRTQASSSRIGAGLLALWDAVVAIDARLQRHPAAKRDTGAMRILVAEDETIIRLDLE